MTTIQKWGNSLAVRIPKDVVMKQRLEVGRSVEVISRGDEIVLCPARIVIPSLRELVKRITKKNRHHLVDWLGMKPVGKEVW